ncbi:MAG: DinB family protein [Solirubrobacterales bacterium]
MSITVTPDALSEARERTLAIVAPYDDHDMQRVTTPLMSPLVWDLAHIAAYEDLWLAHRVRTRGRRGLAPRRASALRPAQPTL